MKIGKAVGSSAQDHDRNGERGNVLLEREIAVHGNKHVERVRGQREQFAVLDRDSAQLAGRLLLVTGDVTSEPQLNALVDLYPHPPCRHLAADGSRRPIR